MSAAAAAQKMLDGFAAGDLAAALEALHPDLVVSHSPGIPWGGDYHGPAGFQKFIGKMMALCDVEILDMEVHDAGAVACSRILARFTERESGRSVEFPVVEMYWEKDGLLSRVEPYYQNQPALNELLGH